MQYANVVDFANQHNLWLPKPLKDWRMLIKPTPGAINGLENTFRGMAVATNGIMVAIETSGNKILFGHLQWFVKDDPGAASDIDEPMLKFRMPAKTQLIMDFAELL